ASFCRFGLHAKGPLVRRNPCFQHIVGGTLLSIPVIEPLNESQFAALPRWTDLRGGIDVQNRTRPLPEACSLISGGHEPRAPIAGSAGGLTRSIAQHDEPWQILRFVA